MAAGAAMVVLIVAQPASAHQVGNGSVIVPADHVLPGQAFEVWGSQLDEGAGVTIRIVFGSTEVELGTSTVGSDGAFTATVTMPASAPLGYAEVEAETSTGMIASTYVLVGERPEGPGGQPASSSDGPAMPYAIAVACAALGGLLLVLAFRSRRRPRP